MTNWFEFAKEICHGTREDRKIDAEIEAEIEAIEVEPKPPKLKPEDWLPTGEELETLLDE